MRARKVITAPLRTGEATTTVMVGAFCGPRVNESMERISGMARGEHNTTRHDECHQRNKKLLVEEEEESGVDGEARTAVVGRGEGE